MAQPPDILEGVFPFLEKAEPALRQELAEQGRRVHLTAGQFVCMEGNLCAHLPLVVEGTARVYKIGETGREITLYRIPPGESCILTASYILSDRAFPAFAVAETDIEAVAVPSYLFRAWFDRYAAWRAYVFDLLARRLASVIELVEEVTFQRMDARIAAYLLATDAVRIETTHEAAAADLGTSREVVSRILKEFERSGWVELGRGVIAMRDAVGLRRAAV